MGNHVENKCGTFSENWESTYSAVKNNDNLNFACKLMELENTILNEIIQKAKYEYGMYSLISGF